MKEDGHGDGHGDGDGDDLRDRIRALEERLLDPAVRADPAVVDALLDPEFTEIGQSGRLWDRAATLDGLAAEAGTQTAAGPALRVSEFRVRQLAPGVVLATYAIAATRTRRSSIWRRDAGDGAGEAGGATGGETGRETGGERGAGSGEARGSGIGWRLVFHQGTRVPE